MLYGTFGKIDIRYGNTVYSEAHLKSRVRSTSGNSLLDTEETSEKNPGKLYEDNVQEKNEYDMYATFIFREICAQVLEIYSALIDALKENSLTENIVPHQNTEHTSHHRHYVSGLNTRGKLKPSSHISEKKHSKRPVCLTPLSLGCAIEEVRYLCELLLPQGCEEPMTSHNGHLALRHVNEQLAEYDKDNDIYRKCNPQTKKPYKGSKFLSMEQLKAESKLHAILVHV